MLAKFCDEWYYGSTVGNVTDSVAGNISGKAVPFHRAHNNTIIERKR